METLAGPSRASALRGAPLDRRCHVRRCSSRIAAVPVTNTAGEPALAVKTTRAAAHSSLTPTSACAGPYRRPPAPGGGTGGAPPRPGGSFAPRPGSGGSFVPRPPGTGPSFSKGPPKPGGADGAPGRGPPRQGFQRRPVGPPPPPLNEQITCVLCTPESLLYHLQRADAGLSVCTRSAAQVRLIGAGPDKPALGVVTLQEALALAKEAGTDLVRHTRVAGCSRREAVCTDAVPACFHPGHDLSGCQPAGVPHHRLQQIPLRAGKLWRGVGGSASLRR